MAPTAPATKRRPASAGVLGRAVSAGALGRLTQIVARPSCPETKSRPTSAPQAAPDDGSGQGQLRRQAAEAVQRRKRHSLSGESWKNGGACGGSVRTASLSRTHGSTTSGLFSDLPPLEASEGIFSKDAAEIWRDNQGSVRRKAAEMAQRSQRHTASGESWKAGGACAGTVRSASLSRTRGGTTSGLFSDFQPLEGSESALAKEMTESAKEMRDEGRLRRQAAEAAQRSQRHSLTGEPWKCSGACAGTSRTASLSRTRGGTTSGLFFDFAPLEASELAAALLEKQISGTAQKQNSKDKENAQKAAPWKSGGACAGTVRAPNLSRTNGTTVSGLFSDVQPLEGSESMVNLLENRGHSRSFATTRASRRRSTGSTHLSTSTGLSEDRLATRSQCEEDKEQDEEEAVVLPLPLAVEKTWTPQEKWQDAQDLAKSCCGSAFATVRAAHCGGA